MLASISLIAQDPGLHKPAGFPSTLPPDPSIDVTIYHPGNEARIPQLDVYLVIIQLFRNRSVEIYKGPLRNEWKPLQSNIHKIPCHFWVYTTLQLWNNIFSTLNIPVMYLKEEGGNPLTEGPEYSLLGFLIQPKKTLSMGCFHSGGNLFKITLNTIWQTPSGIIFC